MAEILKEWLTDRLQRKIFWEAEEFGDMMKNGHIIASVLLSYQVINDEKHFLIRSSNAIEDIKSNWQYLSEWLRELEVHLNDSEIHSIMEGRGSALLRLFYQLFLHLDKRDRTDFLKRERKMVSRLVEKMGKRFKVEKIYDEEESVVDELSKPLLIEKNFIEWQSKKAKKVKDTYDYMRHRYSKTLKRIEETRTPFQYKANVTAPSSEILKKKEKKDVEKFEARYPCKFKNYTYDELIELEKNTVNRQKSLVDTDWTRNYLENLHTKLHKKSDSEEFQKQIRNVLSGSMWESNVEEEETGFDNELAKKVMKMSQFEKQMCTQIMETKQQARNLAKNRRKAEIEFSEQRDHQFNQFLDNVKEQIHLEVAEIDFEKHRQDILHQKLYAEKIKRKRQHYYEICYETLLSIVDYSTKYAYFKRLIGDDIPEHFIYEWKILYFKRQPIFDILESMEDLLKEPDIEEETGPQEEEVIRLELDRQEALNDNEFEEYHNYSGPWDLEILIPNYDPESEERKFEYLGTRILGHVVYSLLEIKYPYPPPLPPADLPTFSTKALLRGLPDRAITIPMQTLLNLNKIYVVRLESAINFCLRQFKREMIGCTDIELSFDKFVAAAKEEGDKELIRFMKTEDEDVKKSIENIATIIGPIPPNAKQTQTPKTIPEEEMKLSASAELGRYCYELLSLGDSLTDHLLAAAIVEYIKDQYSINGFVIINYPNSYREAKILEETFSGNSPPEEEEIIESDDIYLEETIMKHRKKEKDVFKEMRISKLVNDPHKKRIQKPFESYFTCYIKLKPTQDILQELVIWNLNEENSELIDRFFASLGINYSMYYEAIEKDFLAQICKYIIGDYSLPLKSCDTLFGEHVLSILDFSSTEERRPKSKIVKPEVTNGKTKGRVRRTSKSSKNNTENESEIAKPLDSPETIPVDNTALVEEEKMEHELASILTPEVIILAGEEDWDYGEIPIAEFIGTALATIWESVEKTYVCDMKKMFFAIRSQMNCLVPYARFIKDKMEQIITLPSNKQDFVSSFQKGYNDFEDDWRDINVVKNEWHCRIKELQHKLYSICDERKLNAEKSRQELICDNWAMEELTTMVNTYVSGMQTELNRFILTIQTLHDFYFSMLKKLPSTDRLNSKDLTRIYRDISETPGNKKTGDDKVYKQLRAAFQELQLKNIEIDFSNNPFNLIIENNVKFALKVIKDTNDLYRMLIIKEYNEVNKIMPPIKKKEEATDETSMSPEEIFKMNSLKCIEEWIMAVNGEMFRASLRMLALQYKCYHDMKLFNDHIYKTFMNIQNDINTYYMNEITSVDRLCKYLQLAVEEARQIPESLVLEHDNFVIDPNLLQFSPSAPTDTNTLTETADNTQFRIGQLARMRTQCKIVAPTGLALQQAFIYLLQDFILFGKESCEGPLIPEEWKRVDVEKVPKLVYLIFGETPYVDWRDFLIYCLNIGFPTVEQLLEVRKVFRCIDLESTELISREEYLMIELWFEQDFYPDDKHAQLRKVLIKNFLFELYEVSQDSMNYSALLLAFSKSLNPIEGFCAALSMAVGQKTCFDINECIPVVGNLIKLKKYREECVACAHRCAAEFVDMLLTNVIDYCEGITISEVEFEEISTDKKGKKGKVGRIVKVGDRSRSRVNIQKSEVKVKTTFICPPCDEEPRIVEEHSQEMLEEEQSEEPQKDPDLIYAVSQEVIWNVLKICLPGYFQLLPDQKVTEYMEIVKNVFKRLEVDTDNGDIFICKFVAEPDICKLLNKVRKFTALNLADEIRKVWL